jgi:hypothetical protein
MPKPNETYRLGAISSHLSTWISRAGMQAACQGHGGPREPILWTTPPFFGGRTLRNATHDHDPVPRPLAQFGFPFRGFSAWLLLGVVGATSESPIPRCFRCTPSPPAVSVLPECLHSVCAYNVQMHPPWRAFAGVRTSTGRRGPGVSGTRMSSAGTDKVEFVSLCPVNVIPASGDS